MKMVEYGTDDCQPERSFLGELVKRLGCVMLKRIWGEAKCNKDAWAFFAVLMNVKRMVVVVWKSNLKNPISINWIALELGINPPNVRN